MTLKMSMFNAKSHQACLNQYECNLMKELQEKIWSKYLVMVICCDKQVLVKSYFISSAKKHGQQGLAVTCLKYRYHRLVSMFYSNFN